MPALLNILPKHLLQQLLLPGSTRDLDYWKRLAKPLRVSPFPGLCKGATQPHLSVMSRCPARNAIPCTRMLGMRQMCALQARQWALPPPF
eukprot:1156828-Pelagomonas_calceolata.AAC.7